MRINRLHIWCIAAAAALLSGCALEQVMIGQSYIIQTPADGACPALVLQFVVGPGRVMSAVLATALHQPLARLSGPLGADDSFRLTRASGTGGGALTGRFTSDVTTIAIEGDLAGDACAGKTFKLRLGGYFANQGGMFDGGNR